ncbi:CbtB-domain containing protein [Leptolyngbya sp. FACHB-261]|uniref:CbtB domain-containing protein n=1 Tax=Leptolyngbya sp. FACHB-261 TaxID=2692806 RepID=UPI001684665D|nr:CbtB-domain containing protein [Leptolyngbya sp. FACHB-261]MBD2103547.1 CbtB-domain containing protein [Leptolyngbya sp. FACHB-261]
MTASSRLSAKSTLSQKAISFTLSLPVQATLYTSLCALILWTVYFSTYPAVHNSLHSVRHQTLLVGCH